MTARLRSRRLHVFSLISVLLVLTGCGSGSGTDDAGWPDVQVRSTVDGSTVSSTDIVGTDVMVVNLWATWCGPCKRELPMLEEMSSAGTPVIGLNIGDAPDAVDAFLDDLGITFPNYIDVDGEMMSALDVPSVPATMIVANGVLVWRNLGVVSRGDITTQLAALSG